jgi:N,N'-diacetyllegionaminate synthase
MFNELYEKLNLLKECMGNGNLDLNYAEKQYSIYGPMKKAAILNKNVAKGDIFTIDMIDFKRTEQVADLSQVNVINSVGRCLSINVNKDYVLKKKHLI